MMAVLLIMTHVPGSEGMTAGSQRYRQVSGSGTMAFARH
jgi:hypothetical protein